MFRVGECCEELSRDGDRIFVERALPGAYDLAVQGDAWVEDFTARLFGMRPVEYGATVPVGNRVLVVGRE